MSRAQAGRPRTNETVKRQVRIPRPLLDRAEAEAERRTIGFDALVRVALENEIDLTAAVKAARSTK